MLDRVVSITSGHQRVDGHGQRRGYVRMRNQKLKDQREEVRILKNTRTYINKIQQILKSGGQALFVADHVLLMLYQSDEV